MKINYLKGDATNPTGDGLKFIIHVVNCQNGWGKGFVNCISSKWKEPEIEYRKIFSGIPKNQWPDLLGNVYPIVVEKNIVVVNMVAQHGYLNKRLLGTLNYKPPLRLDSLDKCLTKISKAIRKLNNVSIHGPKFGSGLSGESWSNIEPLIIKNFININIPVFIYEK